MAAFLEIYKMYLQMEIAGIPVDIGTPYSVILQEESVPFLCDKKQLAKPDREPFILKLTAADQIPFEPEGGSWQVNQYYKRREGCREIYFCLTRETVPYAKVTWRGRCLEGLYRADAESCVNYSHNLIDLLSLETLLLERGGLILHASFIRWQGKGIVFSAPSGGGKSTQADLWERHAGAQILNGDRTGLRFSEGSWRAFGLPYAGSSGIYLNESAPLTALVILSKSEENRIREIGRAQAFHALFPETLIHRWDREDTEKAVDLLSAMLADTPVYHLECLPDEGAVRLLMEKINEHHAP